MGRVGWREMGGDEVGGGSGDGDGCVGGAGAGGGVTMLDDHGRFVWRCGWYIDRGKGETCSIGLGNSRAVRVLGDGGACALCRALGSVVRVSGVALSLLLGIMGGGAIDLFRIQDRHGSRGSGCVACAVRVVKVC